MNDAAVNAVLRDRGSYGRYAVCPVRVPTRWPVCVPRRGGFMDAAWPYAGRVRADSGGFDCSWGAVSIFHVRISADASQLSQLSPNVFGLAVPSMKYAEMASWGVECPSGGECRRSRSELL